MPIIGIDPGTSNSAAAVLRGGRGRIIEHPCGGSGQSTTEEELRVKIPIGVSRSGTFRCRTGFRLENPRASDVSAGILLDDQHYLVRATILDHGTACLAFALEEKGHVNIWKNRVEAMGFRVGPWLRELKAAILRGEPDDRQFRVWWYAGDGLHEAWLPLGALKSEIAEILHGQKVAYVTDARYSRETGGRSSSSRRRPISSLSRRPSFTGTRRSPRGRTISRPRRRVPSPARPGCGASFPFISRLATAATQNGS